MFLTLPIGCMLKELIGQDFQAIAIFPGRKDGPMSRLNGIFCRSDLRFARNQGKKCRLTPAFLFREYTRNSQAMSNTSSARYYKDLISFVKSKDNKLQDRIRHPDRMVNAVAENELRQYRSAAVLIPVTRLNAEAESCVILTVRSADLNSHPLSLIHI